MKRLANVVKDVTVRATEFYYENKIVELSETIDRVKEIHLVDNDSIVRIGDVYVPLCSADKQIYPCPTLKAIDKNVAGITPDEQMEIIANECIKDKHMLVWNKWHQSYFVFMCELCDSKIEEILDKCSNG